MSDASAKCIWALPLKEVHWYPHNNAIKICDGIFFHFYTRLSHLFNVSNLVLYLHTMYQLYIEYQVNILTLRLCSYTVSFTKFPSENLIRGIPFPSPNTLIVCVCNRLLLTTVAHSHWMVPLGLVVVVVEEGWWVKMIFLSSLPLL